MAPDLGHTPARRIVAIVAVAVLSVGVGVLSVMALQQANPTPPEGGAQPVPTFTLGVQTQTPTPTPTPTPEPSFARETERFLTTASGTLWRAVAGACEATEPLVERSNDGGSSWTDVTPRYLDIAQVASLDALAVDAVEAVTAVDPRCETQALRSFTNGEFWASYPDVLEGSRYVDLADPAIVHMADGPIDAPCDLAHGLRALRETVTLVCDRTAYVWRDDEWLALPGTDAAAVAIVGTDVISAHVTAECEGLALTRFASGDPETGDDAGCAEVTDAAASTAMVARGDDLVVWSGDDLVTVPAR